MPGLTFIAGKQPNPFYTTDLIYDPEVDPSGLVERDRLRQDLQLVLWRARRAEGKEAKRLCLRHQPQASRWSSA